MPTCKLCGSTNTDAPIMLREMMFGTREEFEYFRCQDCDTLQISDIPDDLSQYYPDGYYSFNPKPPKIKDRIKLFLKGETRPDWAKGISKKLSVLDIGCGGGGRLYEMKRWGFNRLYGYDPFCTPSNVNGVVITNEKPAIKGFDLVMMHHAIEHVPDPTDYLALADEYLAPDGRLVIRIPVRQGWAWREYGTNWAHLDPPRHLYHWTVEGFTRFAAANGYEIVKQGFDGTSFSLGFSPLFAADIPMNSPDAVFADGLWLKAAELNKSGDADAAWFIFKRA